MDCSKLNEVFNIDGPNWIPDDPDISIWERQTREEHLKKAKERYADGGLERRRAYKEREGVRERMREWNREYELKNKERRNERRRELYAEKYAENKAYKEKLQQRAREYYWNKKMELRKSL